MPPNLNNIPAADQTETVNPNKFEGLEKLSGEAFEKALAKLSPADREQYLQYR